MKTTVQKVDLPIEGMTCASCASRIERKLNELDGVRASVNYLKIAGAAMALSSVFVGTNSLRLRTFRAERSGRSGLGLEPARGESTYGGPAPDRPPVPDAGEDGEHGRGHWG